VTYGSHSTRYGQGDFVRNSLEKKPPIGYNIYLTDKPKACELEVKSKKLKEALCADG
jgi:hypothetical protein